MSNLSNNFLQVPSFNMDGPGDDETRSHHSGRSVHSGRNTTHSGTPHSHTRHGSTHGSEHGGSSAHGAPRPPSDSGKSRQMASRPASEVGKPASRPGSEVGAAGGPASSGGNQAGNWPQPLGYDPARPQAQGGRPDYNKRLELPPEAYGDKLKTPFARRPGFGSLGRQIRISVNQFPITQMLNKDVYLYDLSLSPPGGLKPEVVTRKCWNSPTMQTKLRATKTVWLYNGRNLAWSTFKAPTELRQMLDLDAEYGRPGGRSQNQHYLTLKCVGKVRMESLRSYLEGKTDFENSVLEGLNFLDHALRQGPSEHMLSIKRNFYVKDFKQGQREKLCCLMADGVVEIMKGTVASIRLSQNIQDGKIGLGVNVDVANTCFWVSQNFEDLVRNYLAAMDNKRFGRIQVAVMADAFRPSSGKRGDQLIWCESEAFKMLRKLQKLRFTVTHRGKFSDQKTYSVKKFIFDQQYGEEGAHSKNFTFTKKTGETLSIFSHFQKQYNVRLTHWRLPLIETSRGGVFPMEVCRVDMHQRYPFKLDPEQTSQMIKFAVTRPKERAEHIISNVNELGWAQDPTLNFLGIKIDTRMAQVAARVIPNPEIQYRAKKVNPAVSGRWDLRGQAFTVANTKPLNSFGLVVIDQCVDKPSAEKFMADFVRIYKQHGGVVTGKPLIMALSSQQENMGAIVEKAYQGIGSANKSHPDMIFFALPNRSVFNYERLKKSADCRYALVTQCLQGQHVRKNSPQYHSNVCMKVNSKLGGQTCKVGNFFTKPTMMIGVDVSHASPGINTPSLAAVTMSMDKEAARYAAAVETNGYRCEILVAANVRTLFGPLVTKWCSIHRTAPQHVFYFRDGVAEGQFAHILEYEIAALRDVFRQACKGIVPLITVIVATKRHHIRFFPKHGDQSAGDRNNNPLPGTVVEREVTHPFHYDFYLCSHVAIQGTARPVHYHVIHDEVKMKPDDLQKMIYQQCYQYSRSTTPVSLHPAVYYAHLAGQRGRSHENSWSADKDPSSKKDRGALGKGGEDTASSFGPRAEALPLLPIGAQGSAWQGNVDHFRTTMWYV